MKNISEFIKTSVIGGLFVLLPLVLFYLLLAELLQLVVTLATPIADLFPKGTFDEVKAPVLIAMALILGASFLFGLALRSANLKRFGLWVERGLLGRLPLYTAVKQLARGLLPGDQENAFKSAVLNSPNGEREIVYIIEEHSDGQVTVLVPFAPAGFAGSVKILPGDRLDVLKGGVGDASRVIAHWGVGAGELIGK